MRNLLKLAGGLVATVVVLLVALVLLVRLFVTPEQIKAVVLPLAEEKLHRRVTLGEVKIGLFSGIELSNLAVSEPGETEPFVAAERAVLRFQLLPLLGRRVVIDEVSLERPVIRVLRRADGSLSFSDLLAAKAGKAPAQVEAPATGATRQPLSVLVSVIKVRDGRLIFTDRQVNATVELDDLQIEASGITLDGTVPVKLSALLQGAPLKVQGVTRPLQKEGTFSVDLQGLDVLRFEPYFHGKVPGKLARLLLDVTGDFTLRGTAVAAKGRLAGRELTLWLLALPTAPLQNAHFAADYDLALDFARDRLDLAALKVDFNGLAAHLDGNITDLTKAPHGELALAIPAQEFARLKAALPAGLLGKAAGVDLAGTLQGSARLSGPCERPLQMLRSGEVTLGNVGLSSGDQRPVVDGRLKLDGNQLVSEGLTVSLGESRAELKLMVRNLFARPLAVAADLTAARFPLEALLGGAAAPVAAAGKEVAVGPAQGAAAADREIGPFDLPLQAAGTVRIGEGGWKGLTVKDFLADYTLRDNQLTIGRMTGGFAGGTFSNSASVDLRQPGLTYAAAVNLKGVEMQSLLPALSTAAANSLSGRLDLNGQVSGRGTRWSNISRSLSGDMALSLADGKLISPALVKGFADFLQIPNLDVIEFRELRGKAQLVNGRAEIDSVLTSDRIRLFPHGTMGLDGSLNLSVDTRLAPELTARIDQRGKVTRYLTDAEGWTQVPLLVSGSVQAPRYGLDPKGVQAQAGKVLEKELLRGLDKLLKPKPPQQQELPPPSSPEQQAVEPAVPPPSPAQQLLDQSLKRLFKKP